MAVEADWRLSAVTLPGVQVVMVDPVVATDRESYERAAMEAWLRDCGAVSPATGLPLESTALVPNHALRNTIQIRASQAHAL